MLNAMSIHAFQLWVGKMLNRWERRLSISKRQQFVAATGILTAGLILTQLVGPEARYICVAFLSLLTYGVSALVLREDLRGIEWLTLLILPACYSAAFALFYFLLPVRWLTRIPAAALYAVGLYALLLTENIYNVALERTIALLRAARSVGFLLTLATYYLFSMSILAFRAPVFLNVILVGAITFLLSLPLLWSMELTTGIEKRVLALALTITIVLMQITWVISFWPSQKPIISLFLSAVFYCLTGIAQEYLVDKLYKKTIFEFFSVSTLVFIVLLLTTNWRSAV